MDLLVFLALTSIFISSSCDSSRDERFIVNSDPVSCNFELSNLCGYTQDGTDNFDWTRHAGSTLSVLTGPTFDHTYGRSQTGHYMYTEASSPRKKGDVARLISPTDHVDGGAHSVGFYYSMYGDGMGTLSVYINGNHGTHHPTFTVQGNHGTSWHYGCVDVPAYSTFKVIIEGTIGANYHSDIAIDDVRLYPRACSSAQSTTPHNLQLSTSLFSNAALLTCTFEHGYCGYTQDRTDDRNWSLHTGNTTSVGTGPSRDHTIPLGKGFYAYMESSSPVQPADKARLMSHVVTRSSRDISIIFWYHMHGIDMGTLNVYLKRGSNLGTPALRLSGEQGNVWKQACIELPSSIGTFQLVFEAVRGKSYHSDIAIDDIKVSSSHCSSLTTDPTDIHVTIDIKPNTVRPTTTKPLQIITGPPSSSVTCDFDEEMLCGYSMASQSTTVNYNWQWIGGQTINTLTGPARDHTTGHGHYMAAVSLGTTSAVGRKANLYSPAFSSTGQQLSVHFWYNTFSSVRSEYGALYVYLDHNGQHSTAVFSSTKAQSSTNWVEVCFDIPANMQNVRLLFQAEHGDGVHGDIAVDDVTLAVGTCQSRSTT